SLELEDVNEQYCSTFSFTDGGKTLTEHKKFQLPFKCRLGGCGVVRIVGSSNGYSHVVVGFGFVLETNDFKVVQIMYDGDSDDFPDVWVYSIEFNTWRKIEAIAPDRGLPNNCFTHQLHLSASASGETLSLFLKFGNQWEAWLMQEYGVVDSWMRKFSLTGEQILWPLKLMNNGNVLLEMQSRNLVSCDAENQQMKDLGISSLQSGFRIFPCTSSLILLDRGEKLLG
ncbi:hypothetical protein C3L33_07884, partial [Rhododendron williamsianum]